MCEDCSQKQPTFGVPGEVPKNRWCKGCAQEHTGAVSMQKQATCEDCTKKPTYGVPGEVPKCRWCKGCAQKQAGRSPWAGRTVYRLRILPLRAENALRQ